MTISTIVLCQDTANENINLCLSTAGEVSDEIIVVDQSRSPFVERALVERRDDVECPIHYIRERPLPSEISSEADAFSCADSDWILYLMGYNHLSVVAKAWIKDFKENSLAERSDVYYVKSEVQVKWPKEIFAPHSDFYIDHIDKEKVQRPVFFANNAVQPAQAHGDARHMSKSVSLCMDWGLSGFIHYSDLIDLAESLRSPLELHGVGVDEYVKALRSKA